MAGSLALCLLLAPAAWGEGGAALRLDAPRAGLLLGDEYRASHTSLVPRFLADLVSIPTGVVGWTRDDWGVFAIWSAAVLATMTGPDSLDVRLQREVHRVFGLREQRFTVWAVTGDVIIWGTIYSAIAAVLIHGWLRDVPAEVELVSLMLEAFGLGQVFQLVPKVLLGREGPMNGDGTGPIRGPFRALDIFPAGTPSGHASTLYALLGVLSAWVDDWRLTLALQAFGAVFCATLVIDDYHFVSDVLWGAAEGFALGEWVVRHRSTRFLNAPAGPVRLLPVVDLRTGAVAVSMAWSF